MAVQFDQVLEAADVQQPLDFFEAVREGFLQAARSVGRVDRVYRVAGHTFRLRSAGPAMMRCLSPALEHLRLPDAGSADWTFCLWDACSTGVSLPPPPWRGEVFGPRGDVRGFNNQRIRTAYRIGAGALSMLDTDRRIGIYAAQDVYRIPPDEAASPLQVLLHWALYQHQVQFIHAGAVGYPEGGVLLAGWGGAGKSTTALSCLDSDLLHVSDDYSLLSTDEGPFVHSVYSSAKLNPDSVEKLPFLQERISSTVRGARGKSIFFLQEHYPEKLIAGFPIRAVLLPRVAGREDTTLSEATPIVSLRALALSTMRQLAGAGNGAMRIMSRLMGNTPCYYLNLGTDARQIPLVISTLLRGGR